MATAEAGDSIGTGDEVCVVRQRGRHLAALAEAIFAKTKHLHGLTKTSLKLVRAAAMARALMLEGFAVNGRGKRSVAGQVTAELGSLERSIVLTAAAGLTCDHVPDRHLLPAASKKRAIAGVTLRIAAILDLAEGLDHFPDPDTRITAVVDDGETVRIEICGGGEAARNAAAATEKTELWNCTALRPVSSVTAVAKPRGAPPLVRADQPVAEAARRILQRHVEQLIARQYGLAYAEDLEYVHEMRVAIRRLRAAMRVFCKSFVGGLKAESKQLCELAGVLGAARDADVFVDFLKKYSKSRPREIRNALRGLIRWERDQRRESYRQLMAICRSSAYQEFLGLLYHAVKSRSVDNGDVVSSEKGLARLVGQRARKALAKGMGQVMKFGKNLHRLTADEQHQLRIGCKKLRYAAEFFTEISPPQLQDVIGSLVQLQDLLGKAHDADVYTARLGLYFDQRQRKKPAADPAAAVRSLRRYLKLRKQNDLEKAAALWKKFVSRRVQTRVEALIASAGV